MYDHTIKDKFIELRARGLSLNSIASKIGVPKATLGDWNHKCLEQIHRLRALQWELLEDEMAYNLEHSLQTIAQRIRRFEDHLDSYDPEQFKRTDLIRIIRQSRLDYLRLRSVLMAPLRRPRADPVWADSQKPDETGRNSNSLSTNPSSTTTCENPDPSLSDS